MNYPGMELAPVQRFDRRTSVIVVGAITLTALAALAVRFPTVPVHGILPLLMGFIIVTELISAALFTSLLVISRMPAAAFAAAAYLLSSTLAFPYLLFFPRLFVAAGSPLGANPQTSFELWIAWHAVYPLALIGYGLMLRFGPSETQHPRRLAGLTIAACVALATAIIAAVLTGVVRVPLVSGNDFTWIARGLVVPALCGLDVLAIVVLWMTTRLRTSLHVWLSVALYASALDVLLGVTSSRYTSGWYTGKFLALASSAIIVVLYLRIFSRMYRDAVGAYDELERARERDAKVQEFQREQQSRLLSQVGGVAGLGTWELDPRTGSIHWSDELYRMFGLPRRSVVSPETYIARVHPDDRSAVRALFEPRPDGEPFAYSHRLVAGDGSVRTIEGRAESVRGSDGQVERWFGTTIDRTERAAIEERLMRALEWDATTDLPNRISARARLVDLLAHRVSGAIKPVALLVIDVDRMKSINDAVGHTGGDHFLEVVARRLEEAAAGAYVARSSGDEFFVILDHFAHRDDVSIFARRLLKAVSPATLIYNREFALSVSIGVATFPADGATADELIRCADMAMYEAKAAGGNGIRFFSGGIRDQQIEAAVLEAEIRAALRAQQFHLEYQPIVDAQTGELFGAEALLRWMHPTRGAVSPAIVIEIAERSGLMGRLGAWVLSEGIRQRARWEPRRFTMALNVSAVQLQNQDFTLLLGRMLAASGLSAASIELELTESAAMEGALVADQMRSCLSMGVHFALDDFGTHYSSLSYLQRLAVERIKIDRSFVRELPGNTRDASIVRALISLAHNLGRSVIAEGVEDQRQLAWLREAGCDYVQGYAIARPMTAIAFERWMSSSHAGNAKTSAVNRA